MAAQTAQDAAANAGRQAWARASRTPASAAAAWSATDHQPVTTTRSVPSGPNDGGPTTAQAARSAP
ncbi:hypothetical protein ABZ570_06730 [Micromonospora sp. NPDC007271]|uniref:hypothetical protein n=1 Tax=Micromonospora sp. NPDC007271 TaxID=3154587 RepID=UPI0033DBFB0B